MAEKNRQPEIPQLTSVGERTPVLLSNQTCEATLGQRQTPAAPLPEQEVVFEGICYAWHTMEVMNHQRENPRSPGGVNRDGSKVRGCVVLGRSSPAAHSYP